jgi:moderate conductance mechanosensitive channel
MIPPLVKPIVQAGKDAGPVWRFMIEQGLLLLIVVVALLAVQQLLFFFIRRVHRFVAREAGAEHPGVKKRADTVSSVLKSVTNVLLIGLGVVFGLEILGIDVRPLIAGAGLAGVALGFGAQGLVKDTLNGIFILAENQMAVGDTVQIAGVTGVVERIRVRSVTLRDGEGRVHYIPSGEIRLVTNLSQGVAKFHVDIPVPADSDAALALAAVLAAGRAFADDPSTRGRLLDPPDVLGYEQLGAGQNTIRVVLRALRQDQSLAREFRYAALRALAAHDIHAGATSREARPNSVPAGADVPVPQHGEPA